MASTSITKRTAEELSAAFRDAIDIRKNPPVKQIGENGMPEYTDLGLGSRILALSQMVRGGDPCSLVDEILSALQAGDDNIQEVVDLIILVFVTRNARGGKGEKDLSFKQFLKIWQAFPETATQLLPLFSHYGYWKDYLLLLVAAKAALTQSEKESLLRATINIMKDQLTKDLSALEDYKKALRDATDEDEIKKLKGKGPSISLLAKWLPREGKSFDKKVKFVGHFSKAMWPDIPEKMDTKTDVKMDTTDKKAWESAAKARYRRTVAELTAFLALPEVLLAAKREEEIRFQRVASKATLRLRKVFLNEDKGGKPRSEDPKRISLAERFRQYVCKKGLKGGQIMPHEIVAIIRKTRNISKGEEEVLDAQWKDLWRGVVAQMEEAAKAGNLEFNPTRMVPMADVSGSMSGTPMEVSIALSIGLSEITHDAFKHMVLTFSSTPTWHHLDPTATIVEKVRSLESAEWGMSTNFEAAYDLILEVVEKAKLSREDMPSLIVFSDMQFDAARGGVDQDTYSVPDSDEEEDVEGEEVDGEDGADTQAEAVDGADMPAEAVDKEDGADMPAEAVDKEDGADMQVEAVSDDNQDGTQGGAVGKEDAADNMQAEAVGKDNEADMQANITITDVEHIPFIHARHVCDSCSISPIVGKRFRAVSTEFDLCEACMKNYKGEHTEFEEVELDRDRKHQARWRQAADKPTMHDVIREKVKRVAERLGWEDSDPTPIVYWNLRNTGGHPVDKDTPGAVLLAGFSPSLLKLVMQGEALQEITVELVQEDGTVVTKKIQVTPEEILRKMLDDKLYDPVREVLAGSVEGQLLDYKIACVEKGIADEGFSLI